MRLSTYPYVGAGYQFVLKIHGSHLDTSSLSVEKFISLVVNVLFRSAISSHLSKRGEQEISWELYRYGLLWIPEGRLKVPPLRVSKASNNKRCSALLLPWDVQNPYSHWGVARTPLCLYSATLLSMMNQVSAYNKGILYMCVNMLMNWFVIGKHFNCHSTFAFKPINISEQSFWKETLAWAVMIHASVK